MLSWIKKHYFWIIVVILMFQTTVYGGVANTSASIYKETVTQDLGMSMGSFSTATSMRTLVLFVAMTFSGPVFKRFGTKIPMVAGLLILSLAYALLSVSNHFPMMAFAFALTGLGEAFVGTAAISRIVNAWFHRHQGSILGLVTACTGLGGAIFSLLLEAVIKSAGWRNARMLSAGFLFAAMLCILLLLRNQPAELGVHPVGVGVSDTKKIKHQKDMHWEGYSFQELLKKPTFYLAVVIFFLSGLSIYSAFSNIPTHLSDHGMSQYGGAMSALMLICLALFKFLCGSICDKIGPQKVSLICLSSAAISLWMLPEITSLTGATIAVVIYSVSVPMTLVVISMLPYPLFGYRSHDATLGIFLAMPYLGSVIITPLIDTVHDRLGSYDLMFRLSAILAVIVVGLLLLLFALAKKDRNKFINASCEQDAT